MDMHHQTGKLEHWKTYLSQKKLLVSINEALLNEEMRCLKPVVTEISKYPKLTVDNNVRQQLQKNNISNSRRKSR